MTWLDLLPRLPHECEPPAGSQRGPGSLWRCPCNRLWVIHEHDTGVSTYTTWCHAGWRLRWQYRRHGIWRDGIPPITLTDAPWDKPPTDFDG